MNAKRWILSFFAALLLLIGAGAGYYAFGGAAWQVRRHFPGAEVFFDPLNSPDPSFPFFARIVFPHYVHPSEPAGIRLANHPGPVDLSHLAGLRLHSVWLTRCKIADLRSLESAGLYPSIHFTDCDFTQLPPGQRQLIRPCDPKNPAAANQFYYEPPSSMVSGLDPL